MSSGRSIAAAMAMVFAFVGLLAPTVARAQTKAQPDALIERPFATPPRHAPKTKAVHGAPQAPVATTEDQARAARLEENRRRFFEDQARQRSEPAKPGPVEFGGYDASTMSGNLSPGFKF